MAVYSCFDGFKLRGGEKRRKCDADECWTGEPPICAESGTYSNIRCIILRKFSFLIYPFIGADDSTSDESSSSESRYDHSDSSDSKHDQSNSDDSGHDHSDSSDSKYDHSDSSDSKYDHSDSSDTGYDRRGHRFRFPAVFRALGRWGRERI